MNKVIPNITIADTVVVGSFVDFSTKVLIIIVYFSPVVTHIELILLVFKITPKVSWIIKNTYKVKSVRFTNKKVSNIIFECLQYKT